METERKDSRLFSACLFTLTVIAVAFSLAWLRPVLIPFLLALFIFLIFSPVIDFQRRVLRIPYPLALIITFLLAAAIIFVFYLLASGSLLQAVPFIDVYENKIKALLNKLISIPLPEQLGLDKDSFFKPLLQDTAKNIGLIIKGAFSAISGILSGIALVLIFVFFLFLGKRLPENKNTIWQKAEAKIKHYIATKSFLSIFLGLLVWGILAAFKIDMAFVFGAAACILNFIPSISPIISTLLPLPVILFNPNIPLSVGFMAIIVPGVLQFIFGNIIEPKVLGDSLSLHPVIVLMALIFWGMIWGIVGMFLAVPLTAIIKLVLEDFESTRPVANLMAGKFS